MDCPCLVPFHLHKFPKAAQASNEWVKALRRTDFKPVKGSLVRNNIYKAKKKNSFGCRNPTLLNIFTIFLATLSFFFVIFDIKFCTILLGTLVLGLVYPEATYLFLLQRNSYSSVKGTDRLLQFTALKDYFWSRLLLVKVTFGQGYFGQGYPAIILNQIPWFSRFPGHFSGKLHDYFKLVAIQIRIYFIAYLLVFPFGKSSKYVNIIILLTVLHSLCMFTENQRINTWIPTK